MCCDDPNLTRQQNKGKCWAVAVFCFGAFNCLNVFNFGAIGGGAVVPVFSALFMIVAGSMPMCCLNRDNSKCIFWSAAIMTVLATLLEAIGMLLLTVAILQVGALRSALVQSAASSSDASSAAFANAAVEVLNGVFTLLVVALVFAIGFVILLICATVHFCKAMKASPSGIEPTTVGVPISEHVIPAPMPVAIAAPMPVAIAQPVVSQAT